MLEFNVNGRLVNLVAGATQTTEQLELIPKIERLLKIADIEYTATISKALVKLFEQYFGFRVDTISYMREYFDHKHDTKLLVLDGKIVSRIPKDCFFCNFCNEWHSLSNTNMTKLDDNKVVCDMALESVVTTCRNCGKRFLSGFRDENGLCETCYMEEQKYRIKRYHDNPVLEFYDENGKTTADNGHFYGLELEVDKGGERNDMSKDVIKLMQDRVYTMHDGSLNNGFEIITHPHTEQALKNLNWKETFKWLIHKGYRSHDMNTCGLHVHINRSVFVNEESIIKMMYFYDKYFDEVLKISRRDRNRASRWAGKYYYSNDEVTLEKCRDIFYDVNAEGDHEMRYKCVNLQKRNTVEIRIMRGTLNYNTFMASLDFIMTVAKNSNKVTDVDDWSQWLAGIEDNTKEYLCVRNAFGYPPEEQVIEDDCYNMTNEEIRQMEEIVCAL